MSTTHPITILLVEDDAGHVRLIEKNLSRDNGHHTIITVTNGQQAIDFIFRQGLFVGRVHPLPLVVLLDLNLPLVDGYQVLERLRADERTKHLPICILTTTTNPDEITRCYESGCNFYLSKPLDYALFAKTIQQLGTFLSYVKIPSIF